MKTNATNETEHPIFGKVIHAYTRAQAIEDGTLVDLSEALTPCPFKFPVAMTIAAYEATIAAGGKWVPDGEGSVLVLPGGQDHQGRVHDVFTMLLHGIRCASGATSRVDFSVLVDKHGNGRHTKVDLYSLCGPGDNAEPVITIMLPTED